MQNALMKKVLIAVNKPLQNIDSFIDRTNDPRHKKYGSEFLYQYKSLLNEEVINQVLSDVKKTLKETETKLEYVRLDFIPELTCSIYKLEITTDKPLRIDVPLLYQPSNFPKEDWAVEGCAYYCRRLRNWDTAKALIDEVMGHCKETGIVIREIKLTETTDLLNEVI